MAVNDFLPFATSDSNVLTQSEYVADAQRVSGNVPGVARSKLVNKAARQAAFITSMIGQFIADQSGLDALDNGDGALLKANYIKALLGLNQSSRYGTDTGSVNVYQVAYSPAATSLVDGSALLFKVKTTNTGASTFSPNGLAAKPLVGLAGTALQGGELIANGTAGVVYSLASDSWVLLYCSGGRLQIPNGTQSKHAVTLGQVQALIPSVPNASTTVAGISRFSTAAEAQSWSEAATVLTPSSLAQSFGAANQSLAPNGYQRLPGGLIIQWAQGPGANPAQDSTISYPIPFPTRTLQAVASMTTDCDCIAQVTSFTQNTVTVRLDQIGSSGAGSAPRVIAIGH
jgi:hypothetical protein